MTPQKIFELFCELVTTDSPTGDEALLREKLQQKLQSFGAETEVDDAGNLRGFLPGTLELPVKMFSSHMDTVEPGRGVKVILDADGRIHSDGTTILGADDKDGITAILAALESIRAKNLPHGPLEFLFTVGEEKNLNGAARINPGWLRSKFAWVIDGPGEIGTIYANGVGKIGFTIDVKGKAAHAGICPEKGINAFVLASQGIMGMQPGNFGDATMNYGNIHGGIADNVVPDHVTLTGEIRSSNPARIRELQKKLCDHWKQWGEVAFTEGYPPYELENPALIRHTENVLQAAGYTPHLKRFFAGSDANYISKLGIDVCLLATGRAQNHTPAETTTLENLENLAFVVERLMLS
ncbi:MAG: M20/M25/M40 family metallo-hydrolase [Lentisphaeria bacterium]|nr:M20/M25/M40 family metallo-hydrolase [Lentisphaeria bacterium]